MAPKKIAKYSEEKLLEAVADVKNKRLTQRKASLKYGVPQSTIADRITGRYAPTILKSGMFQLIVSLFLFFTYKSLLS